MFRDLEMATDDEVMKLVSKLVHRKPEQPRGVVLRQLSELASGHPGRKHLRQELTKTISRHGASRIAKI
jgi:hypothetical protein